MPIHETKENQPSDSSNTNFPSSPIPPTKPALIPHETDRSRFVLPRKNWDGYVEEMNRYITEWNNFQRDMLDLSESGRGTANQYFSLEFDKHQQCILQLGEVREWIRTTGGIL
jgi:hypothetical protein